MPPLDPKTTMSAGARPKQSSQRRSQGHGGALEHPQLPSEQRFGGQTAPNMRGAALFSKSITIFLARLATPLGLA